MLLHAPDVTHAAARGVVGIAVGLGTSASSLMLAQVDGTTELAPFVGASGAAVAVGALAYVARLLASGRLIAVETRERERRYEAMIRRQDEVIESLAELVKQGHHREKEAETREQRLYALVAGRRHTDPTTKGDP